LFYKVLHNNHVTCTLLYWTKLTIYLAFWVKLHNKLEECNVNVLLYCPPYLSHVIFWILINQSTCCRAVGGSQLGWESQQAKLRVVCDCGNGECTRIWCNIVGCLNCRITNSVLRDCIQANLFLLLTVDRLLLPLTVHLFEYVYVHELHQNFQRNLRFLVKFY
jgi:hypothetical protein